MEHIDEPRKERRSPVSGAFQPDLLDTSGRQVKGWTNKLIWGDNKLILASLKGGALRRQIEDAGGLKLIYIDPPFDVGADFSMDIEIGGETFHKEPNLLEQIAYRDTWGRGADSFIAMIYERLILMRDLMHAEGSVYLHCDWKTSGFIRIAMDEVFGKNNFRNEVIWHYPGREMHITAELKAGKSEVVCDAGQLVKISKDKNEVVKREVLTKKWTDWVDYWAVDFNYESRKEVIKVAKSMGVEGELPGVVDAASGEFIEFEERWTGAYIFENEWQSFRTRRDRDLELTTATHTYAKPGRYTVAVKVIDIFGNDTMTLVPLTVG